MAGPIKITDLLDESSNDTLMGDLKKFFLAYNTAVTAGWAGKTPGWSHTGCEGPVIPDEEMPGKKDSVRGTVVICVFLGMLGCVF